MGDDEKRILVVDDDDAIRALLLTILQRRGFKVDTARNGADAIDRCARCRYALVLLDLMMPVMSGYDFLEKLERFSTRPLVIVLTAGTLPKQLNPNVVTGTLHKPFDIELLVDTLKACLDAVSETPQPESSPSPESNDLPPAGDR
jgi:DNA-binding response OmpR family regulator